MASGTARPGSHDAPRRNPAPRGAGRVIEYQQYIDQQLRKTRARVKWVDLWTSLTLLGIGVLAYLLVAVVVDQWVVAGGLGFAGRLTLLVGLLVGVAIHLVTSFVPFFLRRVNPVYAAAAIERGQPLKNVLINFLLLRKHPETVPEPLLEALKEQAAVKLSTVPGEAPVDRTALIRWGIVLTAVLMLSLGYVVASPKNAFRSVRRVMSPWAEIAAPTRVEIKSVEPGDVNKHRDEFVDVKLQAANMRGDDQAVVYFSATGNPADDVALPMQTADGFQWRAALPAGADGLKQDLFYYVQAGDARTPQHRIRVLATPVINVASVRYEYPAYTELPPRTVERQGDLKALEGSRVVLTAEANQQIGEVFVAFDRSRNKDVPLAADESKLQATGSFELALTRDRTKPVHTSYVLRFKNSDGEENPKPIEHKIEVTADQPPTLRVVEPTSPPEQELSLRPGDLMRITAAAHDPDFKLADLAILFDRGGTPLREERLLAEPRFGEFSSTYVLDAGRLQAKPGDRISFRVRAADNKTPQPNVVESRRYTVVIAQESAAQRPQQQPQRQPEPNKNPPGDAKPGDGAPQNNPAQNGRPHDPANGKDSEASGGRKPADGPQQQPPGAGDKQDPAMNARPRDPKQPEAERPSDKPSNDQQPNDKQPNGKQPDDRRPNADQTGGNGPGNSKKEDEPIDPNVDPGKAFEELQKYFAGDDKQQPNDKNGGKPEQDQLAKGDQPKNDEQPGGGAGKRGGSEGPQQGDNKQGGSQAGGQEGGKPSSGGQSSGGDQKPGSQGAQSGSGGEKSDRQGSAERRMGDGSNQGGQEAVHKPKQDGADSQASGGRKPADGNGPKQPKSGEPNTGNPTPKTNDGPQNAGDSGTAGGAPSKPNPDRPADKKGEQPAEKPSVNEGQPAGTERGGTSGDQGKPQGGSPAAQEMSKPRDKQSGTQRQNGNQEAAGDPTKSPSGSRHESEAQGETSGDRSGKGEAGGGQNSNQKGAGASGSSTPGDQGSGAAQEKGDSVTSSQGGDKAASSKPSGGDSSGRSGDGTKSRDGGSQPGGEGKSPNDAQAGKPAPGADGGPGRNGQNPSGQPRGNQSTQGPGGGGIPRSTDPDAAPPDRGEAPPGDEANLEYARKATDLSLDRLKQQLEQGKVDPELVKKFGSREALEQFAKKWDEMRRAAKDPGPQGDAARRQYQDTLKGLGLRPRGTEQQASRTGDDDVRGLRGSRRSEPPAKFADQYRAYTTGIGQPTDAK